MFPVLHVILLATVFSDTTNGTLCGHFLSAFHSIRRSVIHY